MVVDDLPGHEGNVALRLPDGSLRVTSRQADPNEESPDEMGLDEMGLDEAGPDGAAPVGYRAGCSCGWTGAGDHPPTPGGRMAAGSEWWRHLMPLLTTAPPAWLLNRSAVFRDQLAELATKWPLQALGVLAEVERWQRPLAEQAVAAARATGASWAEIGTALGITKQSAHERFHTATTAPPSAAQVDARARKR